MPRGVCPWIGLGYIGCDGTYECRSWVGGEHALVPQVGGPGREWRPLPFACQPLRLTPICKTHSPVAFLQAHVHELGHNLYMAHSGRAGSSEQAALLASGRLHRQACKPAPEVHFLSRFSVGCRVQI